MNFTLEEKKKISIKVSIELSKKMVKILKQYNIKNHDSFEVIMNSLAMFSIDTIKGILESSYISENNDSNKNSLRIEEKKCIIEDFISILNDGFNKFVLKYN